MTSLDQFDVLETLGTGSFGTVSRIRRKVDGKMFVWKEINFGSMSEREKAQLVAEVNILRELRSPFIVKYHDRVVDKPRTRLYIIMEYCAGGDLSAIIKRNRQQRSHVEELFIWKILAQSILALKDCHRRVEGNESKPVLHRDLKPANILLDADLNVKMADFGLAKELSSNTQFAQTNVGTPFYMAPEIINDKKYDEKSDIWSLGCLLYELAALRPPFEAANAVSLAVKINQGRFARIPSRYSDSLFDVIRQMIQLDPRRRPRVEDLENIGALQTHMGGARSIWNEYKFQHIQASKLRELKTKEDSLVAREEALNAREAALNVKEQQLALLEQRLKEMQQRLGQQVDVTAAAAAAAATVVPPCNTTALDMNNSKAYNAAKIQAYRRRISMGRQTEQMNIDDDEDHIAAPVTLDDVPPLPTATTASEPPLPASKPVTSFMPPPPSTSTVNTTSTTSTISTRRGPVPVPTMNKPAPFKVLCDNNHGQDHGTHRIAQQVYGTAPANDNHPTKRAPLQTIKISTGAENAKENIQPSASNNIFKFAAVGNKPHGRPLPYDFQVDSEDASPMKKQRVHVSNDQMVTGANHAGGGFRFQSNITAAGDYMTAAAHNVDGAKKMYR